jgi:drug/metabolite transporter (DMT)-like permease
MPTPSTSQADLPRLAWPLASTTLEALQPLVLVLAFQLGAMHLVRGHNPINFCNGLLFGNAFSLAMLLLIQRTRPVSPPVRRRPWRQLRRVAVPVVINALGEVGLLIALSRVAAVQVALAQALGSVLLLLLVAGRQRRWPMPMALVGSALVVGASWLAAPAGEMVDMMETLAPIGLNLLPNTVAFNGMLLLALTLLSALYFLTSAPVAEELGAIHYGIWQSLLQTVIFFVWATSTFGLQHLYDLQSPLLWLMMLIYGGVISTVYTLVENQALARSGALLVSLFEGLLPLFSALFAWLLLQEAFGFNTLISALLAAIGIACVELA